MIDTGRKMEDGGWTVDDGSSIVYLLPSTFAVDVRANVCH
jgi:hypothetical protein